MLRTLSNNEAKMTQMLSAKQVAEVCGGVCDMTLHRWLRSDQLGFPKPAVVNRRRYWRADEIGEWWTKRATEGAASK